MVDWNSARAKAQQKNDTRLEEAEGAIILNLEDVISSKDLPREGRIRVMEGIADLTGMPHSQLTDFIQLLPQLHQLMSTGQMPAVQAPQQPQALGPGGPAPQAPQPDQGEAQQLRAQLQELQAFVNNVAEAAGLPVRGIRNKSDLDAVVTEVKAKVASLESKAINKDDLKVLEEVHGEINLDPDQLSAIRKPGKLDKIIADTAPKLKKVLDKLNSKSN